MKKIIIAAVAICTAALTQAASVSWGSGALFTATGKDGGWSNTGVMAAGAEVTMSVFLVDQATFDTVSALDQKGIHEWASGKTASYSGVNRNPSTSALIGAVTVSVANTLEASKTYYSIITAEYTDAQYGDMYMASAKSFSTTSAGAGSVAGIFGGNTGVKDWQPVPEPTSGLLLLLGMAGLALRRKQA